MRRDPGEQLPEIVGVVPGRARRAAVLLPLAGDLQRQLGWPKLLPAELAQHDLNRGAEHVRHRCVAGDIGLPGHTVDRQIEAMPARGNGDRAAKGRDCTHHDPQTVAQHAAEREPLELGRQ